jgi:hypothetical protein
MGASRWSVGLALAAVVLAAASWRHIAAGNTAIPEARPAQRSAAAPRPWLRPVARARSARPIFAGRPLEGGPVAPAREETRRGSFRSGASRVAGAAAGPSPPPASSAALGPAAPARRPERTGELVSLEREAADRALGERLVDPASVESRVDALEPQPGETPEDFAQRVDATREGLLSDELLLQWRLSEIYKGTLYPYGFPLQETVVATERQWIAALPPEDRAALLRIVSESWQPTRPRPRFASPNSGFVWRGGRPGS